MAGLIAHGPQLPLREPWHDLVPVFDALPDDPRFAYIFGLHEVLVLGAAAPAQVCGGPAVANVHAAPASATPWACSTTPSGRARRAAHCWEAGPPPDARGRALGDDLVAVARRSPSGAPRSGAWRALLIIQRAIKIAPDPPVGPVFLALPIDVHEEAADLGLFPPGRPPRAGARPLGRAGGRGAPGRRPATARSWSGTPGEGARGDGPRRAARGGGLRRGHRRRPGRRRPSDLPARPALRRGRDPPALAGAHFGSWSVG